MNESNCEKLKVGRSGWIRLKTKKSGVTKWVTEKLEEWIEKPNVLELNRSLYIIIF